ncbi:carcinoembryonic antigen-related cell adhesion molecule 19 isoform X2 [Erinaceus europaeus]|uniref:Carcinoembryonic antigen-related cell adhesion molecule 19 isoform X2 n=1 Tax=Erinaceus europaeus TaxID=9365 RepID=A0ABM3X029_ERIEU|nr:carcinoembryonic antigen-related cell adhesion molecule 19 isoform X2 [Erinaceus europaeus]
MQVPVGAPGLLLTASILALWVPQGSWAALSIQKIPELPQKNQDLLLSVQGVPSGAKSIRWYLGEEAQGSTLLFTYLPGLQQPQREGNQAQLRDVEGFPNGSMLLRNAQPTDSGTYQVAVTINPELTLRAKTQVQVGEGHMSPLIHLPVSTGIIAAIVVGSVATGSLVIGCLVYFLVKQGLTEHNRRASIPRGQGSSSVLFPVLSPTPSTFPSPWLTTTEKPELDPRQSADDNNIYEVMPSPVLLVSPLSDTGAQNNTTDLLNPDPAPYCQLVPAP